MVKCSDLAVLEDPHRLDVTLMLLCILIHGVLVQLLLLVLPWEVLVLLLLAHHLDAVQSTPVQSTPVQCTSL